MAVGASLHNAIMLSRDLGTTLIETTSNVLAAVGIKDADGQAFDFNTIIGQTVENFVKSAVGAENYTKLKQTWIKANRILTAGANLIDSVRSMQNTIIEAQEIVGGWVAKIGNGLSQDGVVNDNTINWMPEKPDFKNPFFRAQQTIENLTEAAESVNQLAAAVIESQELAKQINDNYKTFQEEITFKSNEKKQKKTTRKRNLNQLKLTNLIENKERSKMAISSEWQFVKSFLRKTYNREVNEFFRDIAPNQISENTNGRNSAKRSCLIMPNDSQNMCLIKKINFYFNFHKAHLKLDVYGVPIDSFQEEVTFRPIIQLFFRQDNAAVPDDLQPLRAQISLRLMGETSQSITKSKLIQIGNKIKTELATGRGFVWSKGKLKRVCKDSENGLNLNILCINEREGTEIIKKMALRELLCK